MELLTDVRTHIFDYPIDLLPLEQALATAETHLQNREALHVVTLNPEMIMQGEDDMELGDILRSAGLSLPDGAGLVWALRQRGHRLNRLPGIEFSEALLQKAAAQGYRVAMIGASQEVLTLAMQNLKAKYPQLNIVYSHHGFFKPGEEEARIVDACAATAPQIVLVALGVPRQEKWIRRYHHVLEGSVCVGVGGSLDVWSGQTQRAPSVFRMLNLEWFYRISTQPWRLKRIYKTLPMFVVKVLLSPGTIAAPTPHERKRRP